MTCTFAENQQLREDAPTVRLCTGEEGAVHDPQPVGGMSASPRRLQREQLTEPLNHLANCRR